MASKREETIPPSTRQPASISPSPFPPYPNSVPDLPTLPVATRTSVANTESSKWETPEITNPLYCPGVDLEDRLRVSIRHDTVGTFGRPIFDRLARRWATALPVQDSAKITLPDADAGLQVKLHGIPGWNLDDIETALQSIGTFALAAGRIQVEVVVGIDGSKINHQVSMSGFWMDGNKFVTAAHFLDLTQGTDREETELLLRARGFVSSACVSNAFSSGDRSRQIEGDNFWRVNLVYLDRDADIAVFVPTPDSARKRGTAAYSVDLADVGSIDDENDPIRAEDKNLFATYYPGPPQTVTQANLGQERAREAEKAGITDVFQFLG